MDDNGRNAVTWGVFPGQEVVQTTIIERESFLAWKVCVPSPYTMHHELTCYQDAAFSLWAEWASAYPPRSPEHELLEGVRKERWLVSIVHHDYIHAESLWDFLSDL